MTSIYLIKGVYEFLVKVVILAMRSDICVVRECKSIIDVSKEVYEFLAKVVILVRRSDTCEKK